MQQRQRPARKRRSGRRRGRGEIEQRVHGQQPRRPRPSREHRCQLGQALRRGHRQGGRGLIEDTVETRTAAVGAERRRHRDRAGVEHPQKCDDEVEALRIKQKNALTGGTDAPQRGADPADTLMQLAEGQAAWPRARRP